MGFQSVYLAREIMLDVEIVDGLAALTTLQVLAELPGNSMHEVGTWTFTPATTGRRAMRFRFRGATKGHLWQFILRSTATSAKLLGGRIYARPMGNSAQGWAWYALPIPESPQEYFSAALPIDDTPDEYFQAALPVRPVSPVMTWVDIPVDGIA